jgi:hypothetical protein
MCGEHPPAPLKLMDPRGPDTALAAKSSNVLVTVDRVVYLTDWHAVWHAVWHALQYEG